MTEREKLFASLRENFAGELAAASDVLRNPPEKGFRFGFLHATSYLFSTNGTRWAMDIALREIYHLCPDAETLLAENLRGLEYMLLTHDHDDHFETRTVRTLAALGTVFVAPPFLVPKLRKIGVAEAQILTAQAGETMTLGALSVLPFESLHYRPNTRNGVDEYGYYVTAEGAPSLLFPADVRDYSPEKLPVFPAVDMLFLHIWMGDKICLAENTAFAAPAENLVKFALAFSPRTVLLTHLYENGREDDSMWTERHAEIVRAAILRANPAVRVILPARGETI